MIEFTSTPEKYAYIFGGVEPVIRIAPGIVLRLWSEYAFYFAVRSTSDLSSEKVDRLLFKSKTGTTIYFGINVEGAPFSLGDDCYRQAEGEACGTSVEGAIKPLVIVDSIKGHGPAYSRFENEEYWRAVGPDRPLEDSWRIGNVEMVRWLQQFYGPRTINAYQLLSQVALNPIGNVVVAIYSAVVKAPT